MNKLSLVSKAAELASQPERKLTRTEEAVVNRIGASNVEMLSGEFDPALDFHDSAVSLINDAESSAEFRMKITNRTSENITLVLHPGSLSYGGSLTLLTSPNSPFFNNEENREENRANAIAAIMSMYGAAGVKADAVAVDGIVYVASKNDGDNVIVESMTLDRPVWLFNEFCTNNPTRIPRIIMASNNEDTYNGVMRIIPLGPTQLSKGTEISLFRYFDQKNYKSNFVEIPTADFGRAGLQFDDQHAVTLTIPAKKAGENTIVDLIFKIGATGNQAKELTSKATIARQSIPMLRQLQMSRMR